MYIYHGKWYGIYYVYDVKDSISRWVGVISNSNPNGIQSSDFATSIFACKMIGKEFLLKTCAPKW